MNGFGTQAPGTARPGKTALPRWHQLSVAAAGAGAGAAGAGELAAAPSDAGWAPPLLLPPRKSVTYHPVPLSWNPAAVTCLASAGFPQAGQSVKGASEIFCKASWS